MQKTNERRLPVGYGAATLLTVFAVLCLTVFAVLSLLSAKNALALSRSAADNVRAYYEADAAAIAVLNELDDAEIPFDDGQSVTVVGTEVLFYEKDGERRAAYEIPFGTAQRLSVELHFAGGTCTVIRWQTTADAPPIDDTLGVWDGET